jgi:hypothetical protein
MDQEIRNRLRNVVTQCRSLLEDSISQELEGKHASTVTAQKSRQECVEGSRSSRDDAQRVGEAADN